MNIEFIPEDDVSNSENYINFKILVLGDYCVGKSVIIKKAVMNKFFKDSPATCSFDFSFMHFIVNELKIKLQIWDTMGSRIQRPLIKGLYRNTSLFLLVYDITKKDTFEGLDYWLQDIRCNFYRDIPIIIAGNKYDLENKREVDYNEAKEFSLLNKVRYFTECSAKTGYNIDNIFYEAAKNIYNTYKESGKNKNKISGGKLKITIDKNEDNNHKKSLLDKLFNNKIKNGMDNNEDNTCKKLEKNKIPSEFSSNYILNKYSNF